MASAQLVTHKQLKNTLLAARTGKGAMLALPYPILFSLFLSFLLPMYFLMSM